MSNLLDLSSTPAPFNLFDTETEKSLGRLGIEADSFRMRSTPPETRKDKQYGWYGDLINQAHKLLRLKGAQANAAFMAEDNAFYKQLSELPSSVNSTKFIDQYASSLEVTLMHAQSFPNTPSIDRLTRLLTEERDAIHTLKNPGASVSLLFLWQRLMKQQKIFQASKHATIPADLSTAIHDLVHSEDADRWQDTLQHRLMSLKETHFSLKDPTSGKTIQLVVPYVPSELDNHHPAMTAMGLFGGRMLVDKEVAPEPLRNFLSKMGVTSEISGHWDEMNEEIAQALSRQGYNTKVIDAILVHNGLTISPQEIETLQNAAINSLQELEFIARMQTTQMPDKTTDLLISEISKFAGPQIRSSAPIAETPRQLLVLCDQTLKAAEAFEKTYRSQHPIATQLKTSLGLLKSKYPSPMNDVHALGETYDVQPELQLGILYRGTGNQLLRPEKASNLKTEIDSAIHVISKRQDSAPLVKLLTMLSESLAANHNRHAELSRGQGVA